MKIKLDYENREFFHPAPSSTMMNIIPLILSKLNWQIDVKPEELTRKEAKELISKGLRAAKKKKIILKETEEDVINYQFDLATENHE